MSVGGSWPSRCRWAIPGTTRGIWPVRATRARSRQIELSVDEIRPYENNPRRAANAKFDDIKESIRTSGLRSPLTVTRRPGESHFIVEAGGNTRLLALRQLWAETRDPRFRKLVVLFRPWRSESHVLTAHLIENEQRGEMTFWDKACGIVALKSRLEAEQGRTLTLRPLEDALHALGLSVNTATLGSTSLRHRAAANPRRGGGRSLRPRRQDDPAAAERAEALRAGANARSRRTSSTRRSSNRSFDAFAEQYPHTGAFSVAATCEACEVALARHLGEPVEALREALRTGGRSRRAGRAVGANDRHCGHRHGLQRPACGQRRGRRGRRCSGRRTADAREVLRGRGRPWRRRPSGAAVRRRPAHSSTLADRRCGGSRARTRLVVARWTPRPARAGRAAAGVAGRRRSCNGSSIPTTHRPRRSGSCWPAPGERAACAGSAARSERMRRRASEEA